MLPRDSLDIALERRSVGGVASVLLGMRPQGIVTAAWQLHYFICSMLQQTMSAKVSLRPFDTEFKFTLDDIMSKLSLRVAFKLCSVPNAYIEHLVTALNGNCF